jgi:predicted ATPase/DNA-binding XRE family transcriptional regulator
VPADSTTPFGALLRQHRISAGLTQEALAEQAGLSVYGIQKLERGTTHPYRDTAERLVSALDLPANEAEQLRAAVERIRRHGSLRHTGAEEHHNLSVSVTSFVGREQELAEVPERLQAGRLLTLTGVGGSGKTRLAIEVARRVVGGYRHGVWLVELAQIADPALVPHRIGAVVGARETADRPIARALVEALRNAHILLVLDNCEHLLDASAMLVDLLLRECPMLQILATSREPIGIPGEISWAVPPLAAPAAALASSFGEIQRSPAVRLFVDRARAAQPHFALVEGNAPVVAQICRRLDGIPLALELAAARLDALTEDQLAMRLDQRFKILIAGNRAALPRQQTLGATISWSYELLSETQRRVFECLSVFASGWTLEAAEAVCSSDAVPSDDVVDAVLQLVRKSLVVRIGDGRYGLLETLRDYALDKLRGCGTELPATRERHATYYSALVERLDIAGTTVLVPAISSAPASRPMETLDEAQDNVRVALRFWLEARRLTEGLVLIRAFGHLWGVRGVPADGRRWVEAMLDLADRTPDGVAPALRAQALMFGGMLARIQGDWAADRVFVEKSVAIWGTLNDDVGLAQALSNLGINQQFRGEFEQSNAALSESLALARAAGQPFSVCLALNALGTLARLERQHERAAEYLRESLTLARTLKRPGERGHAVGRALVLLGRALAEHGALAEAMVMYRQAFAERSDAHIAGVTLSQLLDWTAAAFGATGEPLRAARLFGAADTQWRASGARRYPFDDVAYERDLRAVQAQLDAPSFEEAMAEGRAMTAEEAIAHASAEPDRG